MLSKYQSSTIFPVGIYSDGRKMDVIEKKEAEGQQIVNYKKFCIQRF